MPKIVDHQERRQKIVEAVFRVLGDRGVDGVSLRDVANEAGVSMGAVQHYFQSKDEMLAFALSYMKQRASARFAHQVGNLRNPTIRDYLRTILRVLLPTDEQSRQETIVNIAFFSVATTRKRYRYMLKYGYSQLLAISQKQLAAAEDNGELTGFNVDEEAAALFFATQPASTFGR